MSSPTTATGRETPYLDELKLLVAENQLDEPHVRRVAAEVERLVEGLGHPVHGLEVPRPGKHPHADLTGLLLLSLSSFGGFVLLLSGILVVNLLTALMAAQVRQIGVMQAVGGTRGRIARIYLAQALLLGAAAVLVALPLGVWGSRVFCRAMAGFLNFDIASFAAPASPSDSERSCGPGGWWGSCASRSRGPSPTCRAPSSRPTTRAPSTACGWRWR